MRIVCPSCKAEYDVPDALLTSKPRQVRCARCANEWLPAELVAPAPAEPFVVEALPPAPIELHVAPIQVEPAPIRPPTVADETRLPTTHAGPSSRAIAPVLAWAVSLAVIAAAGWSAVNGRDAVIHFWPASQRLYQWLGVG